MAGGVPPDSDRPVRIHSGIARRDGPQEHVRQSSQERVKLGRRTWRLRDLAAPRMTGPQADVLVRYVMADGARQSAPATEWVDAPGLRALDQWGAGGPDCGPSMVKRDRRHTTLQRRSTTTAADLSGICAWQLCPRRRRQSRNHATAVAPGIPLSLRTTPGRETRCSALAWPPRVSADARRRCAGMHP